MLFVFTRRGWAALWVGYVGPDAGGGGGGGAGAAQPARGGHAEAHAAAHTGAEAERGGSDRGGGGTSEAGAVRAHTTPTNHSTLYTHKTVCRTRREKGNYTA